jgi:hypothetical protein
LTRSAVTFESLKLSTFSGKTQENRKKPVETGLLALTIAAESRKVNGGRFSLTRMNTGFQAR